MNTSPHMYLHLLFHGNETRAFHCKQTLANAISQESGPPTLAGPSDKRS